MLNRISSFQKCTTTTKWFVQQKGFLFTILLIASLVGALPITYRVPWANSNSKEGILYSYSSEESSTIVSHHVQQLIYRILQEKSSIVSRKENGDQQIFSARRILSSKNDFTELNNLLSGVTIKIPDMAPINQDLPWPFTSVTIIISGLTCSNANVNDIDLTLNQVDNQKLEASFGIFEIGVDCSLSWQFRYDGGAIMSKIGGNGTAQVYLRNSNLSVTAAIFSKDYRYHFPDSFLLEGCSANFDVTDIKVDGTIGDNLANTFQNAIQKQVESSINGVICKEFDGLDVQITQLLNTTDAKIHTYLPADGWSDSQVDPLATSSDIPKNVSFLDFEGRTLTGTIIQQINSYLYVGGNSSNNQSTSGINGIIKFHLLNDVGVYDVPLDIFFPNTVIFEGVDTLTKTRINVNSVRIAGLGSFTKFDPLTVLAPQVLQSYLALNHLDIEADLSISIQPSTLDNSLLVGSSSPYLDNITVSFGLKNIEGLVSLFLGVDLNRFDDLYLGSVLYSKQILPCFLQAVQAAEITKLYGRVGDLSIPTMTGFISTGLDSLIANVTNATFEALKPWALHLIPGFFEKTVRVALNKKLRDFMSPDSKCPKPTINGNERFVDFRDFLLPSKDASAAGASGMAPYGDMGAYLKKLVDDNVFAVNPDTGLSRINEELIIPLTLSESNISGTYLVHGNLLDYRGNVDIPGLKANFHLEISDARVNNLDSVSSLQLLAPSNSDAHRLDNDAVIGASSKPLEAECKIYLKVTGEKIQIDDEFIIKITLDSAQIMAALVALVDTKALMNFPMRDITNPYCWLATIPAPPLDEFGLRLKNVTTISASLVDLTASVKKAGIALGCVSCSSPGIDELGNVLRTDEGVRQSTNLVNHALSKLVHMMEGLFMQVRVDRLLSEASMRCPHLSTYDRSFTRMQYQSIKAPSYSDDSGSFVAAVAIVLGCSIFLVSLAVFISKFIARCKHRKWLQSLSSDDLQYLHMQQVRENNLQKGLNRNTQAMFMSKDVPILARIMIPIVVLGNIALFISGHLSLGAAVNIEVTLAGQKISINNFFEFSLAHSTVQMWEGGAHVLAIIIAILSGLWPYVKQLLVLCMWFLPPRLVSVQSRGKMFYWLDVLGKWSVIDIFVLVITMVAFRLSIDSPASLSPILSSLYSVDLMIIPQWGLYAMMIAQLLSHVISHFLMHYHRRIVEAGMMRGVGKELSSIRIDRDEGYSVVTEDNGSMVEQPTFRNRSNPKSALRHCIYKVERSSKGNNLIIRSWVEAVLVIIGISSMFLFVLGCVLPSFQIELLGLVGVAVELGQAGVNAANKYSIFQAASVLLDLAKYLNTLGDWMGLTALSLLTTISTCIVPVVQTLSMFGLWFIPMHFDSRVRKKLVFFVEILKAWQYVEVYLLALLIATWQIGGISKFFFNDVVGGKLDGVLGSMVYYGMLSKENAQMFYVVANMEYGAYLLFAGSLLLALLEELILRAEKQQRSQGMRERRENDKMSRHIRAQVSFSDDFEADEVLVKDIRPFPARFTDYFKWLLVSSSADDKQNLELNSTFNQSFDLELTGYSGSPGSKHAKFHPLRSEDSFENSLDLGPAELIHPQDVRMNPLVDDLASLPEENSDSPPNRDRTLSNIANRARRWT
jgi:hypothetical protein